MKVGPKYKIARRLGAGVFEKTSTPKFALKAEKKNAHPKGVRSRSNYGAQLLEKQKVRYTYGISAKQLTNYVKKIIDSKTKSPEAALYKELESRLDNVVLRSGLAQTRFQARQIVSHGHVQVNGKKVKVPSFRVSVGDKVSVKGSSQEKALFVNFKENIKEANIPTWLAVDADKFVVEIKGTPEYKAVELAFDLSEVLQFYKR
jgi:small subunit ribosomal protein S4